MFVMGRDEFGESVGISGSTVWYWIQRLESDRMIDTSRTAKGTIITILNWELYQEYDSTSNNKKTANEQQMNSNKNDKNEKNEKKYTLKLFENNSEEIISRAEELYPNKNCRRAYEDFVGYCKANGKKYSDFRQAYYNWVRTDRFNEYKLTQMDKEMRWVKEMEAQDSTQIDNEDWESKLMKRGGAK